MGIELASARCPSPGPSPLVPRGEGRIRSRVSSHPTASAGPPPPGPLPSQTARGEGENSIALRQSTSRLDRRLGGSTTGTELAPDRVPLSPCPSPPLRGRKGRIRSYDNALSAVLPPPRSLWGRAGEGGLTISRRIIQP